MSDVFLVRYPEEPVKLSHDEAITIGRSRNNTIVLAERRVSRRHARMCWDADRKEFVIADLGSPNATYLNATKLAPSEARELKDWDKIRICSAVFTVRIVESPEMLRKEFRALRDQEELQPTEVVRHLDTFLEQDAVFSGKLEYLCPIELFQMLETGHKSGILCISSKSGEGEYALRDGHIVAGSFGNLSGEQAVFEVMKVSHGEFTFKAQELGDIPEQITASTGFLLMEGCRLLDESAH